jgi:hypothetical protein
VCPAIAHAARTLARSRLIARLTVTCAFLIAIRPFPMHSNAGLGPRTSGGEDRLASSAASCKPAGSQPLPESPLR